MKRFFLALFIMLSVLNASATTQQAINELRSQIVLLLSKENMKPQMDGQAVKFTQDNIIHFAYIYDRNDEAMVVCILTTWSFDEAYTKSTIANIAPAINRIDGVKLLLGDDNFRFESDFIVTDKNNLLKQIKQALKTQDQAYEKTTTMFRRDLGNVDFSQTAEDLYTTGFVKWIIGQNDAAYGIAEYLVESKSPKGYALMGTLYENGIGVNQNPTKMVQYYQKALDGGELWCAYLIGQYYYDEGNYNKAYDYFMQATTDSPFNTRRSSAYNMIGKMLENGQGVTRDIELAKSNYRKSVEFASEMECESRKALARLGEPAESLSDFKEATKIMLSGLSTEDMYKRGLEYENGENERGISLPKAYAYFKAAADRDHELAALKMAEIYRSPYYPFNDPQTSDKYYAKAFKSLRQRENIDPVAAYNLGIMYKNGYSVKADEDEAMKYFQKAARSNSAPANYELGLIYKNQDEPVEAFTYFLKAAEESIEPAMWEVANAYEKGKGTSKSLDDARKWYKKCADMEGENSEGARIAIARLTRPVLNKS